MEPSATVLLLDRWKERKGFESDYQAAKYLGVGQSTLSNWRNGRSHADVVLAARMAEEMGIAVVGVLASIQADRETRPSAQAIWRRIGKAAFMTLLVGVATPGAIPGNHLQASGIQGPVTPSQAMFIMSSRRQRRLEPPRRLKGPTRRSRPRWNKTRRPMNFCTGQIRVVQ